MNELDDIRKQLHRIETALTGDPYNPDAAPGMVDLVQEHGRRIKAIENKHRNVIRWAIAGVGTVVGGAGAAAGAMLVEWVKGGSHTPGGH